MTSFTGSGLLIWYQADLTIDVYNQYVTNNTTIRCEVPGYQSGTNIVTSYWANDQSVSGSQPAFVRVVR